MVSHAYKSSTQEAEKQEEASLEYIIRILGQPRL